MGRVIIAQTDNNIDMNTPSPLIVFLDERVEQTHSSTKVVIGSCIFRCDSWLQFADESRKVGEVRAKRQFQTIEKLLNRIGGVAVVAYSNISPADYVIGEIDGTNDIAKMSRTDNIWAQMMSYSICAGIARVHRSGMPLGLVDVYYDTKDLTADHQTVFENMIRTNIPKLAREAGNNAEELKFGVIERVSKSNHTTQPTSYQRGTMLAHYLCRHSQEAINRGGKGRYLVKDFTEDISLTIQAFRAG